MRLGGRGPGALTRTTLAALLLAAGTAGAEPPATPERSTAVVQGDLGRKLDEYLSRLEALGYSGGLAVVKGGETVLLKGYGQADREGGVPMRPDSVFNLGSITKPFTAAAILRLQELGKLKTSDPIARFFDGVPEDKAGITLEHLLTHSSGLESDFSPTDYEPTTREEYVRRALASKLLFAPGQGYEYANAGYSLLAAVVEKATGKDYETALGELVLKPAGMTETGYKAPRWAKARIAHGYRDGEDWGTILGRIQEPGAPYWALRGNGGLHTTLADMVRWNARPAGQTPSSPRPRARATSARAWPRARGPARTTPSGGRSRRRRTARSCSTTAATASTWPSSAVRGRGRDDLPGLDRRGAEGDAGRAGPHRDRLRRAVRPAAGRRHALPRGPARPGGTVPRAVGRGGGGARRRGRARGDGLRPGRLRPPRRRARRPSASGTSAWERAPRTSRGEPSRATRPASTRPSAGAWTSRRSASRRPS